MQQETIAHLIPLVVRLQGSKLGTVAGSEIFSVASGWPAEQLQKEAEVMTVKTPTQLEMAVQDANVHTIFVPRYAFGMLMLERVLSRNGLTKTIFWEQ